MKTQICLIFAALFLIVGLSTYSNAQTTANKPNINAIQHQQEMRIAQGVRDGSLSSVEVGRLQGREAAIRRMEVRFRASGNELTPMERRRLLGALNQTSQMIYRLRHNQQAPKP